MARSYPNRPIVGVGAVVFRDDRSLLIRRGKPPRMGDWSLPGGMQEIGETVFEAAAREVQEETGVTISDIALIDVASSPPKLVAILDSRGDFLDEEYAEANSIGVTAPAPSVSEITGSSSDSIPILLAVVESLSPPISEANCAKTVFIDLLVASSKEIIPDVLSSLIDLLYSDLSWQGLNIYCFSFSKSI